MMMVAEHGKTGEKNRYVFPDLDQPRALEALSVLIYRVNRCVGTYQCQ